MDLTQMLFHDGLGTMYDKTVRLEKLSLLLCGGCKCGLTLKEEIILNHSNAADILSCFTTIFYRIRVENGYMEPVSQVESKITECERLLEDNAEFKEYLKENIDLVRKHFFK